MTGNHLAQHRELSLLAIGLGVHLQSLPQRAPADIKTLAARFPERATRIAAALRELEAHGYLRRERRRTPTGRIVTRTTSCNQPAAARHRSGPPKARTPESAKPESTTPESTTEEAPTPKVQMPETPAPEARTQEAPPQPCGEGGTPEPRDKRAPRKALPAVPRPEYAAPALLQAATDLLAGLHRQAPRMLLSARDTAHLAPGVAAWLERDVTQAAVRRALTADLPPEGVRHPAAFLAHRLAAQLPPLPAFRAPEADRTPPVRHPRQDCDGCDRPFRAPRPGRCRDCRTGSRVAA